MTEITKRRKIEGAMKTIARVERQSTSRVCQALAWFDRPEKKRHRALKVLARFGALVS